MSSLQPGSRVKFKFPGGIGGYPLDNLWEEVAFIAYYFHWSHDEIMRMPHWERKRWCEEISKINKKLHDKVKR